jgi:hypothetical protein
VSADPVVLERQPPVRDAEVVRDELLARPLVWFVRRYAEEHARQGRVRCALLKSRHQPCQREFLVAVDV